MWFLPFFSPVDDFLSFRSFHFMDWYFQGHDVVEAATSYSNPISFASATSDAIAVSQPLIILGSLSHNASTRHCFPLWTGGSTRKGTMRPHRF